MASGVMETAFDGRSFKKIANHVDTFINNTLKKLPKPSSHTSVSSIEAALEKIRKIREDILDAEFAGMFGSLNKCSIGIWIEQIFA